MGGRERKTGAMRAALERGSAPISYPDGLGSRRKLWPRDTRAICTDKPGVAVTEDGFITTIVVCHARSRGWLAIVVNLRLRYHITHAIGFLYFADNADGINAFTGVFWTRICGTIAPGSVVQACALVVAFIRGR